MNNNNNKNNKNNYGNVGIDIVTLDMVTRFQKSYELN